MNRKITALVGAQFGSEGKGAIANRIANDYNVHVRTGGPNAGHTFVHNGEVFAMQCIPCGWTNPDAMLVLGPGAVINPLLLRKEAADILIRTGIDVMPRLLIDHKATPLLGRHVDIEGHTKGELHKRIGSTGEGVGAARADWLNRDSVNTMLFEDIADLHNLTERLCDTAQFLSQTESSILLEGTQGCGLSLVHGHWPYCTSHDTNAATLCADAGVPPTKLTDVILVARTHPIRVHGNSGPLRGERTWKQMQSKLGHDVTEHTTVTKLERRIGSWDEELFELACRLNAPTEVALTFLDYLNPKDVNVTEFDQLSDESKSFVDYIERRYETRVTFAGTGYNTDTGWVCVDRR